MADPKSAALPLGDAPIGFPGRPKYRGVPDPLPDPSHKGEGEDPLPDPARKGEGEEKPSPQGGGSRTETK
jgi:hypothetical protein